MAPVCEVTAMPKVLYVFLFNVGGHCYTLNFPLYILCIFRF